MKLEIGELKKRWQTRAALAVTIESGRVAIALVRREKGGGASFALPFGADAVIENPEKAGEALAEELDAAGIKEKRCVVCIPASWALTTATDVPEMSAEDLRGYLELRAEREFPIPLAELRLAHSAYALPDGKQRATVAAVPAKRIEAVEKMLEAAGCRAVSISLGLDRYLPHGHPLAAVHFVANGTHVDVVITAGDGIVAVRSLPGAPDAATFDPAGFCREFRITLGRLPDALRQQIQQARFGGTKVAAETLQRATREPLSRMGIEAAAVEAEGEGAALAAARRHLHEEPVLFEFVAPETNRWEALLQRFDGRRRRWIVLAAFAFIVLPVLAFIVRSRIESSLDAEWKGMQRNVAELEELQQRIRKFRPWFDATPQSLQLLEGLMSAFPEQGDVWAKSVEIGEGAKVTCTGFARSQVAWLGLRERLGSRPDVTGLQVQQVRGENPVQFTVTYKWEPKNAQ